MTREVSDSAAEHAAEVDCRSGFWELQTKIFGAGMARLDKRKDKRSGFSARKREDMTMRNRGRLTLFMKLAVFVFISFCVINIFRLQMEYNDLREQAEALEDEKRSYEDDIEKKQEQLEKVFDDACIMDIARDKLNYCMPDEIVIYNDR